MRGEKKKIENFFESKSILSGTTKPFTETEEESKKNEFENASELMNIKIECQKIC